MLRPALVVILVLSACAAPPAIDARLTAADRTAPFPDLVPLGPILAAADATGTAPPVGLADRIAALAARAQDLRGPVIDAATRQRFAQALR